MAKERKRRRWPWIVVSLLTLYIFSLGPVVRWEEANGMFGEISGSALYRPLLWSVDHCPASVRHAYKSYLYLWTPRGPDATNLLQQPIRR